MRPSLPFLSTTSNANLKPGGLLRWKVRLVKDTRLLLPLTEVMEITRLASLLLDMPCQSSPRPRLRHGNPKSVHSLLHSITGSPSSSSFLTFPTVLLPGESTSVYATYLRSHFSVSHPKALCSSQRLPL